MLLASEDGAKTFGVGPKLLGQVLMQRHRDEQFKDFTASFGSSIKTLKTAP